MSPDTPSRTAVQGRLQELAARFVRRSLGEVLIMREKLPAVRANDRAALAEIEQLAHKIHGTAATLGYQALSDCGGELERLAEKIVAGERALDDPACERIAGLISRLETEAQALTVSLS